MTERDVYGLLSIMCRSASVGPVSANRSELHRLVDELDEQYLADAAALLRTLKPTTVVPPQPRRRVSMSGAYDSGHRDTATRPAEILRAGLSRRDPHGGDRRHRAHDH